MKRKIKRTREIRVGLMIIFALAVIVSVVFSIGGQKKMFGEKTKYRIYFDSTGGLFEGDPVYLTGVEVGNVTKLWFPEELGMRKILVEIAVLKDVSPRIRKDTKARIAAASLVYGKVVELTMGSIDQPVVPEGGIIEALDATNYGAIVDSTNLMVEDIRQVLAKLNRGEGMAGMLLNEPMEMRQTLHYLSVSSHKLANLLDRLDQGRGPLGTMLSDSVEFHQTLEDFKQTASDLGDVSENLKISDTALGKLINDKEYGEAVTRDLRSTLHSLASVAAKLDTGRGSLGGLINDPELYVGLQDVVLGVKRSSVAKWLIQNRRKAGEKERKKQEAQDQEKGDR